MLAYLDQTIALEGAADNASSDDRVIVVGSGPVGMRFVKDLLKIDPKAKVLLLGNEPVEPYDRVMLSSLLDRQVTREQINLALPDPAKHPNFSYAVANVTSINRESQTLTDNLGQSHQYQYLVLALGAKAHVPNIRGIEQEGVYRFRTLADAEAICARSARSVEAVVVGGGLLGLEAAKSLLRGGTKVSLIQQGPYLMNKQLDSDAAEMLQAEVEALGIRVITDSGVREILGQGRVEGVRAYHGEELECDTVLVCAGITPNIELARRAGLKVGRGIVVDEELRTSDSDVFAIGECCEHEGQTYGLVNPGYEQAAVAANVIRDNEALYKGSMAVSRLKVVGQSVASMGDVVDPAWRPRLSQIVFRDTRNKRYRKLVLLKGRVIGALAFGEWTEASRIQNCYQNNFYVWPWQRLMFRLMGRLWIRQPDVHVQQWPDKAIVCNCRQITKGEILEFAKLENASLASVQEGCGASSVCGSCRPLVEDLMDRPSKSTAEVAALTIFLSSLLASVIAMSLWLVDGFSVADSVTSVNWFERIWNDKFWKQVTGFTLVGFTVVGLLMSLRKRFDWQWMGKFPYWRAVHTMLGVFCIALLILHTGFHVGENLNQLLMLNFVSLVILGSLAGLIIALSHRMPHKASMRLRKAWTWAHVIVAWPLPALLIAHIASVYYF